MTKSTDLSNAEFKGKVLAKLDSLDSQVSAVVGDLSELKKGWLALEEGKVSDALNRIGKLEGQQNGSKMTWDKVVALGGIVVALLAIFWKH